MRVLHHPSDLHCVLPAHKTGDLRKLGATIPFHSTTELFHLHTNSCACASAATQLPRTLRLARIEASDAVNFAL